MTRDPFPRRKDLRLQHARDLLVRHERSQQPIRPGSNDLDRSAMNFIDPPERALRWARAVVAGEDVCDWPSQMPEDEYRAGKRGEG